MISTQAAGVARSETTVNTRVPPSAVFRRRQALRIDIDQQHVRAVLEERSRGRDADAAGAAGDDDALAGEFRHLRPPARGSRAWPSPGRAA